MDKEPQTEVFDLPQYLREMCDYVEEAAETIEELKAKNERLRRFLTKTPVTDDNVLYMPYRDPRRFYAVWRHDDSEPWKVSECRTPQDMDEIELDLRLDLPLPVDWQSWSIEDAEDDYEVFGVYSTREAAEARLRSWLKGERPLW